MSKTSLHPHLGKKWNWNSCQKQKGKTGSGSEPPQKGEEWLRTTKYKQQSEVIRAKQHRRLKTVQQNREQPSGEGHIHIELFMSTCVNAKWVEILHVADGDAVISNVPHHLILHLLPAQQRLFHQDLTAHGQSLDRKQFWLDFHLCTASRLNLRILLMMSIQCLQPILNPWQDCRCIKSEDRA